MLGSIRRTLGSAGRDRARGGLWLAVLALAVCCGREPRVPDVLLYELGIKVVVQHEGAEPRLVMALDEGTRRELPAELLDKTLGELRPFFAGSRYHHVVVRTEQRTSEDGRLRELHYLLRDEGRDVRLICHWEGSEHQRGGALRTLLRTVSMSPVEGEATPTFELERYDYNREFEGHKERTVTRVELPPSGECHKSVTERTSNAPQE